ncbi:hypothetical protein [Micromonospora carbonacea]|uniref:Uncharacterized protein n=1 Tax=Micromonospora carbonacea TaxID=47853 RepID=A0A1C5A3H4_9ACTN|nr:hypothetical protein [Micromonospora carbonacea]SCF39748.1 hypothetical protein GA0070563_11160 [Micromonospora carbonacea]
MADRDSPCPGAHPVAHGRPPLPDGHVVPHPPRPAAPALTRRQYAVGWVCAALLLAAALIGMLR